MIKVNGYSNYFGGKSGNGTYQTIINHIPPHDVFYSLYLGNCGITRNIKPAMLNVLNDLDSRVIDRWRESVLPSNYALYNEPAINILKAMQDGFYLQKSFERGFIYLDPPYRKSSRKSQADIYKYELTDKWKTR